MRYAKKWELNAEYNMTQEQKELLLKDLCARLPYGVKVQIKNEIVVLDSICDDDGYYFNFIGEDREGVTIEQIKPYLFPLSSMIKEERKEYEGFVYKNIELDYERYYDVIDIDYSDCLIDFYHKYHFDYRGLIKKGLALDASGLFIY